ncbi:MAG: endolytic transglycosylase MltG [Paludibacteraceae bacterium]|nr:endolytic transglycosylase MltG [Paludibacteraceae bacterium]
MKKRKRNRSAVLLVVVFLLLGTWAVLDGYHDLLSNLSSCDGEPHRYYVYPNTPMDSVLAQMEKDYTIASKGSLRRYARWKNFECPRPGYYEFGRFVSNRSLVGHLQYGRQTPINLRFTNQIRNNAQLASRMGKVLMVDSAEVMARLNDADYLEQFGLNSATAVCLFIPNTYEVYWTISVDELFARMKKEYDTFWTEQRLQQAKNLGLSPTEVATLASIVESETNNTTEHPTIASLYLNRLRKGMALQACPTVIFASGDFSTHRVTQRLLRINSPYNTYKNVGLPPGPIRCPNGKAIDAVLQAPKTDYLYMCANPDWSGTHVFSATYEQHQRVAVAYRRELNKRGIK